MRHVLLAALAALAACRLPNPDHCVHKHVDSDAWCAANVPGRPYCSPCAAERHGCVAARPDDDACPAYAPDSSSGDTDGDTTGTTAAEPDTEP